MKSQKVSHAALRRGCLPVLAATALLLTAACGGTSESRGSDDSKSADPLDGKKVCIDQFATNSVIDDMVQSIKATLSQASTGIKIEIENPNADPATEKTIDQKFLTSGCDVVVPVATAAAQLAATVIRDIPIVFAASSTPVEAKLVKSMDKPGGNITGVADVLDPRPEIDAMRKLMPDLKTVGLIWMSGNTAGDTLAKQCIDYLDQLGIKHITATITNSGEVTQAAQSLVGRVQAIELPGDAPTVSAAGGIMKVADGAKVPVFGGTTNAVKLGALVAGSYDYKVVGVDVANLVLKILRGADPADTPVVIPETGGLDLNLTKLKELGIAVPDEVRAKALTTF